MSLLKPSDYTLDLLDERLVVIRDFMLEGRKTSLASDSFHPELGDDAWTVGTTAYKRIGRLILDAADSLDYPWLTLVNPMPDLVFRIGKTTARFGNGDENQNPRKKLRRPHITEILAIQEEIRFSNEPRRINTTTVWRFVYNVGADLDYNSIHLVLIDEEAEGAPLYVYPLYKRDDIVEFASFYERAAEVGEPMAKVPTAEVKGKP